MIQSYVNEIEFQHWQLCPNCVFQRSSDTTVKKGEQMELKVRIRGQPNPEVEW